MVYVRATDTFKQQKLQLHYYNCDVKGSLCMLLKGCYFRKHSYGLRQMIYIAIPVWRHIVFNNLLFFFFQIPIFFDNPDDFYTNLAKAIYVQ